MPEVEAAFRVDDHITACLFTMLGRVGRFGQWAQDEMFCNGIFEALVWWEGRRDDASTVRWSDRD